MTKKAIDCYRSLPAQINIYAVTGSFNFRYCIMRKQSFTQYMRYK